MKMDVSVFDVFDNVKNLSSFKVFYSMIRTLSNGEEMKSVFGEPQITYRFNIIKGISRITTYSQLAKYFKTPRSTFYEVLDELESANLIKAEPEAVYINPMYVRFDNTDECWGETAKKF